MNDDDLKITITLQARVTPEIFLFSSDRRLIYRGAIDNWFYELGKNRREATEFYFIDAVKAALENQEPPVRETEAIGCLIQYPHEHRH